MSTLEVPLGLRRWFVVHFIADLAFAIPLMLAPRWTLGLLGWGSVDAISARLVAAALFAIGTESWLMRNASVEQFRTMLRLKCLWSGAALAALALSIAAGAPVFVWVILVIFGAFSAVWQFYRVQLAEQPGR
jgi:hypothetical protein